MIRYLALLLSFNLLLASLVLGVDPSPPIFSLQGYLGKEQLAPLNQSLNNMTSSQLIIEINSTSGDLTSVFEVAKKLFELKIERHLNVIIYIENNALGPAAILPLLADQLYTSLFVSWGDIPLGVENPPAANILRSQVMSLISPEHPLAHLLQVIAMGMSDPTLLIVNQQGWKIANKEEASEQVIKPAGETLVLSHNQLRQLGLIKDSLSPSQFQTQWGLSKTEAIPPLSLAITKKNLDRELQEHIKFNPRGPNTIGLISIIDHNSGINQSTWLYVKNALDEYKQKKPSFIILELDTPGGEVFAAQKISDALKEMDTQYGIPVVAFINNWAISAGAMLAYSCRFIAVAKDASMGAAEPLTLEASTGKTEIASEKVNSALRTDFANRAAFFGRNPYLAEAMVDKDTILVLRHGKIIKLNNENQIHTTGPDPDQLINPKGKLLTLSAQQLMDFGVADILLLPQKLEGITPQELQEGRWPASKMSLFKQPFFKDIPQAFIEAYQPDWKTRFFGFLANPLISSLLFMGLLIGFYMEVSTPGFGLAGTVAVTCLTLIILSSFALEIANWLEVILLLLGIAIILIELFFLPTFGLLGFIGILSFVTGLLGLMLPGVGSISYEVDTKTFNAAGEAFLERLAWLCGAFVLASIIILAMSRFIRPSWIGLRRFVLAGNEQEGYFAGDSPDLLPPSGSTGIAYSALRPSGKIIINDTIYDAVTRGGFIEKETPIIVEYLEGSVIVVRRGEDF
jgi:membrane-bound serine protease (ClpP class)